MGVEGEGEAGPGVPEGMLRVPALVVAPWQLRLGTVCSRGERWETPLAPGAGPSAAPSVSEFPLEKPQFSGIFDSAKRPLLEASSWLLPRSPRHARSVPGT